MHITRTKKKKGDNLTYVFKLGLSLLTHLRRQDFPVRGNKPLDRMELQSLGPYLLTCFKSTSSSSLLHGPFFMYVLSNSLPICTWNFQCLLNNWFFFSRKRSSGYLWCRRIFEMVRARAGCAPVRWGSWVRHALARVMETDMIG